MSEFSDNLSLSNGTNIRQNGYGYNCNHVTDSDIRIIVSPRVQNDTICFH